MKMWGNLNLREHLTIGQPQFIAQLKIEYTDGATQTIVSNEEWKTHEGPIIRNNIYLGEIYDARNEIGVGILSDLMIVIGPFLKFLKKNSGNFRLRINRLLKLQENLVQ